MDDDNVVREEEKPLDLDTVLNIIQNPLRRKILEYLAREPHYPLQLAKKIGVSQQSIVKHLNVMEDAGIVESVPGEGGGHRGPPRRYYVPKRRFTVIMDVGKNMFRTELRTYSDEVEGEEAEDLLSSADSEQSIVKRVRELNKLSGEKKLIAIRHLLDDVEARLTALEKDREALVVLRDRLLEEAHDEILDIFGDYNRRLVMYSVLEGGVRGIDTLAEALNMREKILRDILRDLEYMLRYY